MFGSFIIGIIFGLGSKFVAEPIASFATSKVELNDGETAVITFGVIMAVASLLLALLTSNPSPFWLILGGTLGVFGFRIFEFGKAKVEENRAADDAIENVKDAASDVKDAASDAVEDVKDAVQK